MSALSAETPLFPLAIGEASAVAGDNGLSATMRVSLLNLASPPATVKLYLGDTLVRTWSDVAETGDFEHTATTEANRKYTFRFVATAAGETVTASGAFQTVAAEDWFNVRWGEDGYATGTSWNVAGAVSKSGGSWTRPSGDESAFDGARLSLVPPDEGTSLLRFAPTKPVKAGADITVRYANGLEEKIPAPNLNGGGHNGTDLVTLRKFFDYVDAGVAKPSDPERILSSVMIPMAAMENKLVQTGEWYRSIVKS